MQNKLASSGYICFKNSHFDELTGAGEPVRPAYPSVGLRSVDGGALRLSTEGETREEEKLPPSGGKRNRKMRLHFINK